jgi:hypothetical protein
MTATLDRDTHMAAWLDALEVQLGQRPAPFHSSRYGASLRVWLGKGRSEVLPLPSKPPTPERVAEVLKQLRGQR